MRELELYPVPAGDDIKSALTVAGLPVDDLDERGRSYFQLLDGQDSIVGYSGLEECGSACLLRSMMILPEFRSRGYGRQLAELTIAQAPLGCEVYLATTSAETFFEGLGFVAVQRDDVPSTILSTRQLSGLCPASATIMKLTRHPT